MKGTERYRIGDLVLLSRDREGVIKYVGYVNFSDKIHCGIELCEGTVGNTDGEKNGHRYFACASNRGVLIPLKQIRRRVREKDHFTTRKLKRRNSLKQMANVNRQKLTNRVTVVSSAQTPPMDSSQHSADGDAPRCPSWLNGQCLSPRQRREPPLVNAISSSVQSTRSAESTLQCSGKRTIHSNWRWKHRENVDRVQANHGKMKKEQSPSAATAMKQNKRASFKTNVSVLLHHQSANESPRAMHSEHAQPQQQQQGQGQGPPLELKQWSMSNPTKMRRPLLMHSMAHHPQKHHRQQRSYGVPQSVTDCISSSPDAVYFDKAPPVQLCQQCGGCGTVKSPMSAMSDHFDFVVLAASPSLDRIPSADVGVDREHSHDQLSMGTHSICENNNDCGPNTLSLYSAADAFTGSTFLRPSGGGARAPPSLPHHHDVGDEKENVPPLPLNHHPLPLPPQRVGAHSQGTFNAVNAEQRISIDLDDGFSSNQHIPSLPTSAHHHYHHGDASKSLGVRANSFWCDDDEETLPGYSGGPDAAEMVEVPSPQQPMSPQNHMVFLADSEMSSCVQSEYGGGSSQSNAVTKNTSKAPGRIKGIEPYTAKWTVSCKGMVPSVKIKRNTAGRRRSSMMAKRRRNSSAAADMNVSYTFSIYKDGSVNLQNKKAFGWNGNAKIVRNVEEQVFEIHPVEKGKSTEYQLIWLNGDDDTLCIEHYNTAVVGMSSRSVFKAMRT